MPAINNVIPLTAINILFICSSSSTVKKPEIVPYKKTMGNTYPVYQAISETSIHLWFSAYWKGWRPDYRSRPLPE
jgi:hypothetical protein